MQLEVELLERQQDKEREHEMHTQEMMLPFMQQMMQQMTDASYAHSSHSYHHPHTTLNFVNEEAPTYPPVTEPPNTTSRNN